MFWLPNVPKGYLTTNLQEIGSLKLIINGEYKTRITKLSKLAETERQETGNPAFRMLQILAALRD